MDPSLEAIVLYLDADGIRHLVPHGRETLRAAWDPDLDPAEAIVDAVADIGVAPLMVHSTSWRVVRRQVVLTFLVVIERPVDVPEIAEKFKAWSESRNKFNKDLRFKDSQAAQEKWQKEYLQGYGPGGMKAPQHQTKLVLREFELPKSPT